MTESKWMLHCKYSSQKETSRSSTQLPHFTEGKTKAHRGVVTFPGQPSESVAQPCPEVWFPDSWAELFPTFHTGPYVTGRFPKSCWDILRRNWVLETVMSGKIETKWIIGIFRNCWDPEALLVLRWAALLPGIGQEWGWQEEEMEMHSQLPHTPPPTAAGAASLLVDREHWSENPWHVDGNSGISNSGTQASAQVMSIKWQRNRPR